MKKIIIIALAVFTLASCGQNSDNVKKETWEKNVQVEKTEVKVVEVEENGEKKISFNDLEVSLGKLKNVELESMELEMLDMQLQDTLKRNIEKRAIENNDAKICEKLDKNLAENCKNEVFVKTGKIENCNGLVGKWNIDNCKNEINTNLAEKSLDENICEKIIDNSEDKYKINSCKNKIIIKKAEKNLDLKICEQIIDNSEEKFEIQMCKDIVEMFKKDKEMEKDISL